MANKWFVSRQCYWGVEDPNVVEIAGGGLDYANADMLVTKYEGEGEEYTDPREAVEVALAIAETWRKDEPFMTIGVAHGHTGGFTMPFELSEEKELKTWAEKIYAALPKCDHCGELLGDVTYSDEFGDFQFCREYCAERHTDDREET